MEVTTASVGLSKPVQQYREVLFEPVWNEQKAADAREARGVREANLFEPPTGETI